MDSTLDLAYRQTLYIIESPSGEFVLKVEELNPAVDSLLTDYRADSCAFITAWNPSSQRLTEPVNEQRQRDLIAEVRRRGYTFLPVWFIKTKRRPWFRCDGHSFGSSTSHGVVFDRYSVPQTSGKAERPRPWRESLSDPDSSELGIA